jgi:amidase/6-aminohexanoate-cyclic-dimer hydrolase
LCENLGHHVEEARPVFDADALGYAFRVIVGANVCLHLETRAAALGRQLAASDVEKVTWSHAMAGRGHTAVDYARAVGLFHATGRKVARFFAGYDVLLSPTMCQPPYPIGVLDMANEDDAAFLAAILASVGFTSLFNTTGNPAVSLPLGWSKAGLPLGVQFAARFGDEATLFRLAAQLETAQPWADRRPN